MAKKEFLVYVGDASCFRGNANAIIFPKSIDEIKRIVRAASGVDVVPRGGGSGLVGGAVPQGSIVLDLSKLNKILDIDLARKLAYVEPGVILQDLNEELAEFNLELPVYPLSEKICTIGGMVATNACGSRVIKYGRMNRWVREMDIIDGSGNLRHIGRTDISDFAGMEGITGIIIKIGISLIEKKKRTLSIFQSDSIDEIMNINKKLKLMSEVSMIDFFDRKISNILGLKYRYHLFVEFESERGRLSGKEYDKMLKFKKGVYKILASKGYVVFGDVKFFSDKIKDFVIYSEDNDIPFFAHLGEGIVRLFFTDEGKREKTHEFAKKIRGVVGGSFGIGLLKKKYLDDSEKELIKRVKMRYDSEFKINKNKMIDYEKISFEPEKKLFEETQGKTPGEEIEKFIEEVAKEEEVRESEDKKEADYVYKKGGMSKEGEDEVKKIVGGFFG